MTSVSRWLPLLTTLVSGLLPLAAAGAPPEAAANAEARAWFARVQAAAQGGNYQGVMIFSAGGTFSSSRVGHYTVGDNIYEQVEALDGRLQRMLRHNDAIHTLWPQAKLAVIEKRETLAPASTTPQAVDPIALEQYEFRREAAGRVAGRDVQVVFLEPRDALRYAQRLWSDQATGLMLRADVIGVAGPGQPRPVLETTAFSEVTIGVRPQAEQVLQQIRGLRKLEGYKVLRPQQQRSNLEAEGWVLAKPVEGFVLAGCVRRGMATGGDDKPVLQAVFTDGLSHVSLFVEPFQPERHRGEMVAQQGATGTLMARRGDWWITAVGDVPTATLKRFAEALERRRP